MKNALLTGATSGIGLAIGKRLAAEGYEVFGIGRTPEKVGALPEHFRLFSCDVTDDSAINQLFELFSSRFRVSFFDVVVFAAGVGCYGPHETLSAGDIKALVRTNLEAPMLLSARLLPAMKQNKSGHLIFLSSVTAEKSNTYGCAYGATKAALTSFAESLFDEVRKTGVKITILQPDMTKTDLYRHADFCAEETACLFPEDVAETVAFALSLPEHCNLTKLTLQPQRHRLKKQPRAHAQE